MRKFVLISVGGLLAAAAVVFVVVGFPEHKQFNPEQDQTDLFPARSQEKIQEIKEKDTEFTETEKVNPSVCKDFDCFEKHYQYMVSQQTIDEAFADLKVRYDTNTSVRSLCHPLVHVIGRAALEKYPDIAEAYTKGDHFCWSGYYHGVMEAILYKTTPEELPNTINAICDSVPGKATYSFDYYNCVHGLGHGVMYITNNELFDALVLCDNLQGGWEQESCYGGVFMENVITDFENHFTKYLKPEEPLYPCTAVAEKNKHACYLMQTSYVLKENGYNFMDAFAQCSTVEEQHKDTCYQSVGRDASGSTVSDVQRTKVYCLLGANERQETGCVVGAVKDFISYFHSDVQAKQFCNSFKDVDENLTNTCIFIANNYYKSFTPSPD
jgi:hypothetical protein